MRTPKTRMTIVLGAAALLLTLPACGKKSLDKNVDRLVKAAQANDYDAFRKMSHPSLVSEFSPEKFKILSESLKLLGEYKDRSMRGIKARTGKVREGRYKLTFAKGKVRLRLTLKRGKLIGFRFEGDDLEKAMKKARAKAFSEFKVGTFKFLDTDGKRKNNVFKVEQKARFKLSLNGMKRQGGTLKIQAGIRVVDSGGKVVVQNPKFLDSAVPIKADDIPVGNVSGAVTIQSPGHYTLYIRLSDGHSGKSLIHKEAILVEK